MALIPLSLPQATEGRQSPQTIVLAIDRASVAPPGLARFGAVARFPGLTPWATDCRPSGAKKTNAPQSIMSQRKITIKIVNTEIFLIFIRLDLRHLRMNRFVPPGPPQGWGTRLADLGSAL